MIITQKKPVEELLAMLEGVTKVAIVGCGQCAAACQTGGEKDFLLYTSPSPRVRQQSRLRWSG